MRKPTAISPNTAFHTEAGEADRSSSSLRRASESNRLSLLLPRLQVLRQALEPHHQRGVALNLDVLVLDALHKGQLLVLRIHGGEAVGAVLEADGEGRFGSGAAMAGDALILDHVVSRDLAVEGMQQKCQGFID